jgi:hypothetical protein
VGVKDAKDRAPCAATEVSEDVTCDSMGLLCLHLLTGVPS